MYLCAYKKILTMKDEVFNRHTVILLFLFSIVKAFASVSVCELRCESIENPLGIDVTAPALSWQLKSDERGIYQSAYELQVANSIDDLESGNNLLWNSGKKTSSHSLNIIYEGPTLKPFTRYYWRVKVYDRRGRETEWSKPAWWETSMFHSTDWKALWIYDGSQDPENEDDYYTDNPAPIFRKEFAVRREVSSARLYISGLGYYEATINGHKVGDHYLDPGWTNYDKDILYATYDVTSMINSSSENCIGVMLGNGFYNPIPMPIFRNLRKYLTVGRPTFIAQLRIVYNDGSQELICSDDSWKFSEGPVMRNNVYLGEHYDARNIVKGWNKCGFADDYWRSAVINYDAPKGDLVAQIQPPVRIKEVIKPVKMTESRLGVFVFDMGQNFAGVAKIKVKGPAGTVVKIRYGEDVYSDGSLNGMTSVAGQHKKVWNANRDTIGAPQTAWQEDSYILKGEGEEEWMPRFTFHGFRYVEICGWPGRPDLNCIEGIRMCADLEQNGYFESSNKILNKLHKMLDYTFRSNVFSVQSDCPAREKFGYGGDIVAVSRTFMYMYGMKNFYLKTIKDFANDQRPSGAITETAPYNGLAGQGFEDGGGPIGWQLAFAYLQKQLYDYYGDIRPIKQYYPKFQKQIAFLLAQAKDYVIDRCINDHESLDKRIPALFATAQFYFHAKLITEFAGLLGKDRDEKKYQQLAEQIRKAFIREYVKSEDGTVGNATPSTQAFGLYFNLVPKTLKSLAAQQLLKSIADRNNHMTAGIFGVPAILTVLSDMNRNDIAYQMVTNTDYPGWGHMIKSKATTLWETWKYSNHVFSHNHPMFGSVGEWMYQSLGGIKSTAPGFKEFRIKPQPVDSLDSVSCTYKSPYGDIKCCWKQKQNKFNMDINVPANTTAEVFLPIHVWQIKEGDDYITEVKGVDYIGEEDGYCKLSVQSGEYHFHQ